MNEYRTQAGRLAALAAALLLAGCANMKGIGTEATLHTPPVPGASTQAVAPVPIDWWREFGDPQLDRLEAKGLVARVRSSEDRRVVNLELTREGRLAAKEIPAVLCKVQNAFLEGLSVAEWQQLKDLLRRILANGHALEGASQGQE